MQQRPPVQAALLALAFALTIAACGSSDDSEASDPAGSSTDTGETASAESGDAGTGASEDAGDEGDAGAAVAVGSGTLTIDGVENTGFEGECEIARANGAEPVGDVSTGELDTLVIMDNVASGPAQEMNFSITSGTILSIRETDAAPTSGTVESVAYVGEPSGNAANVVFNGTTDDGRAVVAEVGCSLYEI